MPLSLNLLPARYGDCIWLRYGSDLQYNILIDGGTGGTRKEIKEFAKSLPEDRRNVELAIVTHVDRDHIEGMLRLLESEDLDFTVSDFWFNGYKHLVEDKLEALGAEMGEDLSAQIERLGLPWNSTFDGKAIVIEDGAKSLPVIQLEGGLSVTLLSPYRKHLLDLEPVWVKEIIEAGLRPGYGGEESKTLEEFGDTAFPDVEALNKTVFKEDKAEANGSSIAIMITYGGKNILLAGDAFPGTLLRSLNTLSPASSVLVSIAKLSHHASKGNTSPALLDKIECERFAISTNGSIYKHPSAETIARVIKRYEHPEFYFNYKSPYTAVWDNVILKEQYKFSTFYPNDEGWITILL